MTFRIKRRNPEDYDFAFRRGDVLLTRLDQWTMLLLVGEHTFIMESRHVGYDGHSLRVRQQHGKDEQP